MTLRALVRTARSERAVKITHLVLLALIVSGLAAWLHRIYGFEPLTIKEPSIQGAKR